jgi:hypothetical protein
MERSLRSGRSRIQERKTSNQRTMLRMWNCGYGPESCPRRAVEAGFLTSSPALPDEDHFREWAILCRPHSCGSRHAR